MTNFGKAITKKSLIYVLGHADPKKPLAGKKSQLHLRRLLDPLLFIMHQRSILNCFGRAVFLTCQLSRPKFVASGDYFDMSFIIL